VSLLIQTVCWIEEASHGWHDRILWICAHGWCAWWRTAIPDQLDSPLDEAAERELTLRERSPYSASARSPA
jgi:hypothetical protein